MQNDFLTGSLGGEHCRKAIPECVRLLQEEKWEKVFLTIDTHDEDYLNTLEGRKLPVIHCLRDTWGQKVCREIADVVNQMKHVEEIPSNERMFVEVEKDKRVYYEGVQFKAGRDEYFPVPIQQYNLTGGAYVQNPGYAAFSGM